MKPSCAVLAAAALSLAALSVPTAVGASAPALTTLEGFSDIVADPGHGQVFISEGAAGKVAVTDEAGQIVTTVDSLEGAAGMVLSPDARMVAVALPGADAVAMIDTTTLAVTTVGTGVDSCPATVAFTGDALWFGYGCSPTEGGNLGEIQLGTQDVSTDLIDAGYAGPAPLLAADALVMHGTLFVGQPASSPGDVYRYEVTGGSDPTATLVNHAVAGARLRDLAISPSGDELLVAAEQQSVARRFSTADLTPHFGYVTGGAPNAVAYRHDGIVAVGLSGQDPNLNIFKPGFRGRFRTYQLGTRLARDLQPGGLAFGDTRLFAVTARPGGANPELHVILPQHLTSLTIRTNKAIYDFDEPAMVIAHLGYTAVGRVVTISARAFGGTPHVVKRGRVNRSGNLIAFSHVLKRTTFTAAFAGDGLSTPARAQVALQVHARVMNSLRGYYGRSGIYHLYHLNDDPVLTATVLPRAPGTCVYFRGQYLVNGVWKTGWVTPCGRLNAFSRQFLRLIGDHWLGERVRMRAEWRNHPANLGAVGEWQYSRFTAEAKSAAGPEAPVGRGYGQQDIRGQVGAG